MTDRKNNDPKVDAFETEPTVERSNNRQAGRAPRRGERVERRREGVPVYEQATSVLPAGTNLSWGSIIAGAVTAAACFATLSLITAALGFGLFSPTNAHPLDGVGVGTGIWTAITLILSFLAGGYIAGYSARKSGLLHGAITWALSLLLLLTLVLNTISSVLGTAANVAGNVAGGIGNVAGSAITATNDAIGSGFEAAGNAIGGANIDNEELQSDIEKYLSDTDIPELQPDYLNNQLEESKNEIAQAVKNVAINPDTAQDEIDRVASDLAERAQTIADSADRDAIANAVAANSDLTPAEAEEVTDNIYNGLQEANKQAQETLDDASVKVQQLSNQAQRTVDETVAGAREGAEEASNKLSAGSVITFLGLLAALALSAWGGKLGEEKSTDLVRKDTIR
ncbi:YrzE family protein [Anaerococcus sp. ENR1011]|uniref:YrzE family protein n=1 Tax=Anaerococcus groningensis TaxID=3115616 RepID=A0ABW9MYY8_9FIRM